MPMRRMHHIVARRRCFKAFVVGTLLYVSLQVSSSLASSQSGVGPSPPECDAGSDPSNTAGEDGQDKTCIGPSPDAPWRAALVAGMRRLGRILRLGRSRRPRSARQGGGPDDQPGTGKKKTKPASAQAPTQANTQGGEGNMNTLHPREKCTLYLAESSIPNSGFGVYSAVDVKEGQRVGEEELLIPITDTDHGDGADPWLLKDVVWHAGIDGRLLYESNEDNSIFFPGFGAQINCHFGLNNVQQDYTTTRYGSAGLHRSKDPGSGAFTYWHGITAIALRSIRAGEELFVSYGSPDWFMNKLGIVVPSEDEYEEADKIIAKAYKLLYGEDEEASGEEEDSVEDGNDYKKNNEELRKRDKLTAWRKLSLDAKYKHGATLKKLLPESPEDLKEAHRLGSARYELGGDSSFRSQEWLEEHGTCIDNVDVKKSDVPQAGRGAFAKRLIPKGSVVSPAPVLQIHRRQLELELSLEETEGQEISGKQLLTNYAYGHRDSDVVLVPYNMLVNFINHGDSWEEGDVPNAEIRWSESPLHRKDYLELDADDVLRQKMGLLMEIVATRDIRPDEEVLLDYGPEWQRAWERHSEGWAPLEGSAEYVSEEVLTEQQAKMGILTEEEQKSNPYPDGTHTACYFYHTEETVYDTEEYDEEADVTVYRAEWEEQNDDCLRHCKILSRRTNGTTGETFYDVELLPQTEYLPEDCHHDEDELVFVNNVPSGSCFLVRSKFARDQHLPNAFRHVIGLPDGLLPEAWRRKSGDNIEEETTSEVEDEEEEESEDEEEEDSEDEFRR